MNGLKKEFVKLNPADKIASIGIIISIFAIITTGISVSIAYLGHSINSAVEERNKHEWAIAQASNLKTFWEDIEKVENSILKQTKVVGKDAGEFVRSTYKVLNEISSLKSINKSIKINAENKMLNAAFLVFISTYAKQQASIEAVAIRYDNSVLIYNPMIKVLGVNGWEKYLRQASKLKKWKSNTMLPYKEAYNLINKITKFGEVPNDYEKIIIDLGFKLSHSQNNLATPSLDGILSLKKENYPNNI